MTRATQWLESRIACNQWFRELKAKGHPVAVVSRASGRFSVWRETPEGREPDRWKNEYRIEEEANNFRREMEREKSAAGTALARA